MSEFLPTWMSSYIDEAGRKRRGHDYAAPMYYMFPQPEKYYENLKQWLSPPVKPQQSEKINRTNFVIEIA